MTEQFVFWIGMIALIGNVYAFSFAIMQNTRGIWSGLLYKVFPSIAGISSAIFICLSIWG